MAKVRMRRITPYQSAGLARQGSDHVSVVEHSLASGAVTVALGQPHSQFDVYFEAIAIDESSDQSGPRLRFSREFVPVESINAWLDEVEAKNIATQSTQQNTYRLLVAVNGFPADPWLISRIYEVLNISQFHRYSQSNGKNVNLCTHYDEHGGFDCYARLIWAPHDRISFASNYQARLSRTTGLLLVSSEYVRILDWMTAFQRATLDPMLLPVLVLEAICSSYTGESRNIRNYDSILNYSYGQPQIWNTSRTPSSVTELGQQHNQIMQHLRETKDDRKDALYALNKDLGQALRSEGYRRLQMSPDVTRLYDHYKQQGAKILQSLSQHRYRYELWLSVIQQLMQQEVNKRSQQATAAAREDTKIALRDSSQMKAVAVLTMLFLPTTALASIFSMGSLLTDDETGQLRVSQQFWLFWAVSIPLTLVVMTCYLAWIQRDSLPNFWEARSTSKAKRPNQARELDLGTSPWTPTAYEAQEGDDTITNSGLR